MFPVGNAERYVDRYIGRHSIDIAVDSRSIVDRLATDSRSSVDRLAIDCRSSVDAPRPHTGHMSVVYRPTIGDIKRRYDPRTCWTI